MQKGRKIGKIIWYIQRKGMVGVLRLKSLELQGFKSFPDKTVISFEDGITAIVGPNGSGKSNISDGVRWVLGEQSTKNLRGSKMEDVIFSGTVKRGAVGFAEVSLTIDNSDGVLPTEYNEVTVTRRLYRSGESEYYINRSAVRLRDINEMFMDTGLGRDGYSIIGQGRIDEILSAKSGDRREIFEEASGISKFRHRKEESERKLQSTEDNLVRLRDILAEITEQVEPLRKQSEKAKEYLKIYDELRGLEISVWLANLAKAKENAAKYINDYEVACSQFAFAKAAVDSLYAEAEKLSEKMREKDVEAEDTREERRGLERRISEQDSEISSLEATVSNNVHNIERMREELSSEDGRAGELKSQIEEKIARIEELAALCDTLTQEIEALKNQALAASSGSDDAEARLDEVRSKERLCEGEIAELKIKLSSEGASCESMKQRISDIDAEIEKNEEDFKGSKEKYAAVKSEYDEAKEKHDSVSNMLNGFELKYKSRGERFEKAKEAFEKLSLKIESSENKHRILYEMERDYQGYSNAVKSVMRAGEKNAIRGILGTVSQLMQVEDKYTLAIETILGAALQNVVVSDEGAAKDAIAYLKNSDGGRATFLPLTSVKGSELDKQGVEACPGFVGLASRLVSFDKKYDAIFKSLLGRAVVSENINTASSMAKKYGYSFRIVTLDGQIINAGGSYTGGSASRNAGILSRGNEIKRLEAELSELRSKKEKAESEKLESEREYTALVYQMDVCRKDKREAEDALLKTQTEIEHYKLLHESFNARIDALNDEKTELSAKISVKLRENAALSEAIASKEAELSKLSEKEQEMIEGNAALAARRTELSEKIAECNLKLAECRTESGETEKSRDELYRLSEAMQGDRSQKEQVIRDYEAANEGLKLEIEEKKNAKSEIEEAMKAVEVRLSEISNERIALEAERNRKEKEGKDKNEEILRLERERSRLEMRKESAAGEEQQITEKLWDSYELTIGTAEKYVVEIPSVTAASKRVSELKGAVRRLGDVNVGSIEEYAKVSERYEFMTKQCGDLEKAKAELLKMIGDITGEMKTIFAERFAVINKNFGETFSEIFGGGKAELVLEDEDDILGCGIEIRVQPPGKTLKTITLLSGGERAFVAIALYFAIMKVRPTPFCVLDEIEAALDDVNVARFAEYLRRLTKTTQFIVITHRRGTMEEADALYGVTMQEKGISKMLAISIADIEKETGVKLT